MKINFDASFSNHQKKASTGIVVRNNHGLVMGSYPCPLGKSDDSTMAEALACLQAVSFGEDLGFLNIIVEGDALRVLEKLKEAKKDRSVIGNIIEAIKKKRSEFFTIEFCHISRKTNVVAHKIVEIG